MELLIIRHAEPAWDRDGLAVDDPGLTDRGAEQAARLGESMRGVRADALLVSPLLRARQTAAPVADALGLEPITHDWMAELFLGAWEGTPNEVVQQTLRDSRGRPADEQWEGVPGGESFRDFHRRVTVGLQALLDEAGITRMAHPLPLWELEPVDRRIVLVAHSGTNAVALSYLLGVEPVPWEWERFVSYHASLSTVRPVEVGGAHSFSLLRFADTSHLAPDLQTR